MTNDEIYEPTLSSGHQPGEIVVGVDDGPAAAAAVRWAAEQSRLVGLPLCVVHAWQMSAFEAAAMAAGSGNASCLRRRVRTREPVRQSGSATRWVLRATGCCGASRSSRPRAGPALVAESRGAHLLVIGTQEHTGLRRAVLGSVSHYCLSHAQVPVVAVSATQPTPHKAIKHDVYATPGPLL